MSGKATTDNATIATAFDEAVRAAVAAALHGVVLPAISKMLRVDYEIDVTPDELAAKPALGVPPAAASAQKVPNIGGKPKLTDEGCQWRFTGASASKSGSLCGKPRVEGFDYCRACLRKRKVQEELKAKGIEPPPAKAKGEAKEKKPRTKKPVDPKDGDEEDLALNEHDREGVFVDKFGYLFLEDPDAKEESLRYQVFGVLRDGKEHPLTAEEQKVVIKRNLAYNAEGFARLYPNAAKAAEPAEKAPAKKPAKKAAGKKAPKKGAAKGADESSESGSE